VSECDQCSEMAEKHTCRWRIKATEQAEQLRERIRPMEQAISIWRPKPATDMLPVCERTRDEQGKTGEPL
jgi:hypothetical protein